MDCRDEPAMSAEQSGANSANMTHLWGDGNKVCELDRLGQQSSRRAVGHDPTLAWG